MVGPVNSFINIVMIKQAQWFWSKLETTSLEDTLIKLGMVKILLISACNSHNLHAFLHWRITVWKITTHCDSQPQANDSNICKFSLR